MEISKRSRHFSKVLVDGAPLKMFTQHVSCFVPSSKIKPGLSSLRRLLSAPSGLGDGTLCSLQPFGPLPNVGLFALLLPQNYMLTHPSYLEFSEQELAYQRIYGPDIITQELHEKGLKKVKDRRRERKEQEGNSVRQFQRAGRNMLIRCRICLSHTREMCNGFLASGFDLAQPCLLALRE